MNVGIGYTNDRFQSVVYVSNVYSNSGFFANAHGLEPRQVNAVMHDASSRDVMKPSQAVNHFKVISATSYKTAHHTIEIDLGYQRNFRQEFSQYVNHGYMPAIYPDTMSIPPALERQFDKEVYSANLRHQRTKGRHVLSIGVSGEHQDNAISGWTFVVPAYRQTTVGAFAYEKFQVHNKLLLHGALRFDHAQMQMNRYEDWFESELSTGGVTQPARVVRSRDLSRYFNSLVWSVGFNYNPGLVSVKANVGKSFRMPIAKELGANGVNYHYFAFERGDPSLEPEQSYQADLSVGWKNEKWSVQLSPFFNYFPNYIYLNPTAAHDRDYGAGNQVFQYAQSSVRRYGGELQLKYRVFKSLSAEVLGEYLHTEQLSGSKKGYSLPFAPPASLLWNLTWSPTWCSWDPYLSIDYRMTARQNDIVPPEKKTPGYRVINIQAGAMINAYGQPMVLSLQAQNLLNTRYLNHTSFYRLIALPEAGRNIVVALKVPFPISSQSKKTNP